MNTIKAKDIKVGDMVRVSGQWEMWVETVRNADDGRLIIWGADVRYLNPNDEVIVTGKNWVVL